MTAVVKGASVCRVDVAGDQRPVRLRLQPGLFSDSLRHVLLADGMSVTMETLGELHLGDGERLVTDEDLPAIRGGSDVLLLPDGSAGMALLITPAGMVSLDGLEDVRLRWRGPVTAPIIQSAAASPSGRPARQQPAVW